MFHAPITGGQSFLYPVFDKPSDVDIHTVEKMRDQNVSQGGNVNLSSVEAHDNGVSFPAPKLRDPIYATCVTWALAATAKWA